MQKWQIKAMDSMLLAVFNQTTLPRGQGNQTMCDYKFTAPLVIAGEMTLESASVKHRIIEAFFDSCKIKGKAGYFNNLCQLPLSSFGKGLLQHMLTLPEEQLYRVFEEQISSVDPDMDGRFRSNAALVRIGLWLIINYFEANNIDVDEYADGFKCIDSAIKETMAVARLTNIDKMISDLSIMANTKRGSGNWLIPGYHYEVRNDRLYIKTAETYALYQQYAKSHRTQSEPIGKTSFLQQLQSKEYYVSKGTIRIGDKVCNGICLDIATLPDGVDVDFAVQITAETARVA